MCDVVSAVRAVFAVRAAFRLQHVSQAQCGDPAITLNRDTIWHSDRTFRGRCSQPRIGQHETHVALRTLKVVAVTVLIMLPVQEAPSAMRTFEYFM